MLGREVPAEGARWFSPRRRQQSLIFTLTLTLARFDPLPYQISLLRKSGMKTATLLKSGMKNDQYDGGSRENVAVLAGWMGCMWFKQNK